MRKIPHSELPDICVPIQLSYVTSSKQWSCRIYCRYTFSPLFSELHRQFRREDYLSHVWNLILHETTSSPQISAMEVSLHQPQADMDWHANLERCYWTPVLELCSLASVGVRGLILLRISFSSICSFMRLAPFRSLALRHLLSQFIWQGTLVILCVSHVCSWSGKQRLDCASRKFEKNPHISAWHSSSLRLLELLLTPSPVREEMSEWLVFLLSLECTSPRGL